MTKWTRLIDRAASRSGSSWSLPWWRHKMEIFSASLTICAGNSPVTCEFPAQRPVTRSFDVSFDLRLNERLSKRWWGWWFETSSHPLWGLSNANTQPTDIHGVVLDVFLKYIRAPHTIFMHNYQHICHFVCCSRREGSRVIIALHTNIFSCDQWWTDTLWQKRLLHPHWRQ